jgi:iron complex outermembrane receptor protein
VSLNYKITPDVMAYVSYRHGYKSGGFQSIFPPTPAVAATAFEPEKVKSYEVGLKSEWFDRRFLANVAVFLSDISNQQISRNVSPTEVLIDNAGATRDYGVDLTLSAKPIPELTLTAAMTVQHARFQNYVDNGISYAGNSQLRSPDFSTNFAAEYAVPLGNGSQVVLHGDYSYESKQFFDDANSMEPGLFQPGYGIANARAEFIPRVGNWSFALWGRNLGNTEYYQNIGIAFPTGIAVPGEPRTYGVSLNYKFQ